MRRGSQTISAVVESTTGSPSTKARMRFAVGWMRSSGKRGEEVLGEVERHADFGTRPGRSSRFGHDASAARALSAELSRRGTRASRRTRRRPGAAARGRGAGGARRRPGRCRACACAAASSSRSRAFSASSCHHPADALEVHPFGGQLGDAAQHLDVGVGVAAVAALRARRVEQAAPLVLAQRLGMHAGELGGDRDDVHRSGASLPDHHTFTSCDWRRAAPRSPRAARESGRAGRRRRS